MNKSLLHTTANLHLIQSTLVEEDSYFILSKYLSDNSHYHKYSYPSQELSSVRNKADNFCSFAAKIKMGNDLSHSFIPISIFRFVLLENLSFSNYYTNHRKPGYIVEGYIWTNGMVYQVREDTQKNFDIYELTLLVDQPTAFYMRFDQL